MAKQEEGGDPSQRDLSQQRHRRLIGELGLTLPLLVYLLAAWFEPGCSTRYEVLDSVSAYYWTGAGGLFVGVLFALALFLATYGGYENALADRIVGKIAGLGALGVALFPTAAPQRPGAGCTVATQAWWSEWMRTAHYACAGVLFLCFFLFAAWLFRRTGVADPKDRPAEKVWRDRVSLTCGITILAALGWAVVDRQDSIFVPEAIAIAAFAVSWLIKGGAHQSVLAVLRR